MKPPRPLFLLSAMLLSFPAFPQSAATKQSSPKAAKSAGAAPKSPAATKTGATSGKKPAPGAGATTDPGAPSGAEPAPTPSPSSKSKASPARKASAKGTSKKGGSARARRTRGQQAPDAQRISEIQQALFDRGYILDVNGKWDQSSVEALRKFQEDKKITNMSGRGKLDSLTLIALGLGPKKAPPPEGPGAPKAVPEGKIP